MNELEAKTAVIEAAREMKRRGLIVRTWGNISARISDTQFVITPSGRDYESLMPDDIVTMNLSDGSYEGGTLPSSEWKVHQAGYATRPEVSFLIHTHQPKASALSILGKPIDHIFGYMEEAGRLLGGSIPCAGYGRNGSDRLKENVGAVLSQNPDANAILMKNHGVLCLGRDKEEAFAIAETLEQVADFRYREMVQNVPLQDADIRASWSVFERDTDKGWEKREPIYKLKNTNCIIYCRSPYVKRLCEYKREIVPYLDDAAQIAGKTLPFLASGCRYGEIALALNGRNAVLVEDVGAVCTGVNQDETKAVCLVLEKAAMAAVLGIEKRIPPLSLSNASHARREYVRKYAKLR